MIVSVRKSKPRGFTLVEMVLVVGAVTALLGLAAGLIHILLRLDRYSRNYLNDSMAVSRLSDQFRADVRRAIEATTGGNEPPVKASLALTAPNDLKVAYTWEGNWLKRVVAEPGKEPKFERYRVDRLSPIVFESKEGFVSVEAGRTPENSESAFRSKIRIEARLGKRNRPSQAGGAEK